MSSGVYVERAADWAHKLTQAETRSPGDYDNAMRRVGEELKIKYGTLWGLRYRRPKSLAVDAYFVLAGAYEAIRERQLKALGEDIEATATACGPDANSIRSALALVRQATEGD